MNQITKNNFLKGVTGAIGVFIIILFIDNLLLAILSAFATFSFFNYKIFEDYLLGNMSFVIFVIFLFLIYNLEPDFYINNNKDIYLMIGGLIAFWYGYKKYERDKDLDFFLKFNENGNKDLDLELWENIFNFNQIGLVSKNTFNLFDKKFKLELSKIISQYHEKRFNINPIIDFNNTDFILYLKNEIKAYEDIPIDQIEINARKIKTDIIK